MRGVCVFALLALLGVVGTHLAEALVLGIDLGEEFFKVAMVSPGRPFEILLNVHSKRKTPSALTFVGETRLFGEDALAQSSKSPPFVFQHINSILGFNSSRPFDIGFPSKYYPYVIEKDEERGTVKVQISPDGKKLYPEEIVSHLLRHIKSMALPGDKMKQNVDCVIAIPVGFSARQRQALLDAAEIAGLRVLGLLQENSAAALHHALDLPNNATENKVFLNFGSKNTQVCVVSYAPIKKKGSSKDTPHIRVLGCSMSQDSGGHHIDVLIADAMAAAFQRKTGTDVTTNARALKKLLRQASRSKTFLSTNRDTDFFIESFLNDADLRHKITREELDKMLDPFVPRIEKVFKTAMEISGVPTGEITGVEIMGGNVRVPKIQATIESLVKPHELGQHVNGDEGMALGAALLAANHSSLFRIKDMLFTEAAARSYRVELDGTDGFTKNREIVAVGTKLWGAKALNVKPSTDLKVRLYESGHPEGEVLLSSYDVTGLTAAMKEEEYNKWGVAKTSLVFRVDPVGIVRFERAVSQWDETYMEEVKVPIVKPKDEKNGDKKNGDGKNDKKDGSKKEEEEKEGEKNDKKSEKKEEEEYKIEKVEKKRKKTLKLTVVGVDAKPIPMSAEEKKAAATRLNEWEVADRQLILLAQSKNDLESFVYSTREKLEDKIVKQVSTEEQREALKKRLMENEDWLLEEENFKLVDVQKRHKELRDQLEPILERATELQHRPVVVERFRQVLKEARISLEKLNTTHAWIPANKTEEVIAVMDRAEAWFDGKLKEQEKISLLEAPVITVKSTMAKLAELHEKITALLSIPKPKVKKEKPKIAANATQANATSVNATEAEGHDLDEDFEAVETPTEAGVSSGATPSEASSSKDEKKDEL